LFSIHIICVPEKNISTFEEEGKGREKESYKEELHKVHSAPNIVSDQIKESDMGIYSMFGDNINASKFQPKCWKG
jgi:hypothetical protein